ncbi:MAG: M23 family metallopeptidase [Candidatus Sericytochromatia bacterium]|nr:M23 family metallopeptidase [Candidatus Sericytochromatia bacterium]
MISPLLLAQLSAAPLYISLSPIERLPQNWRLPVEGRISNAFGNSYSYYSVYRGGHTGVDLKAPQGSPVRSPADGTVVRVVQQNNLRYGHYLILQHGPRLFSLSAHLQQIQVRQGQKVRQGDVLARVGTTGSAGYPHLHFEVFSHLPSADGAWGYLYICHPQPASSRVSFVNQPAVSFSSIYRGYRQPCTARSLKEPMTYYNPELFWSLGQHLPLRQVGPPQNEWHDRQAQK